MTKYSHMSVSDNEVQTSGGHETVPSANGFLKQNGLDEMSVVESQGLLISMIPTDMIDANFLTRDRMCVDDAELTELRVSILSSGQRLPIEVFPNADGTFALLSGYRRLMAIRMLYKTYGDPKHETIKAIVRPMTDMAGAFSAMVEENEVRSGVSHFERGRIAVVAAQKHVFSCPEEAITNLFKSASKTKRSKIRAFAEIYETLGDVLQFPEALSERRGLRLSQSLRQGGEAELTAALELADVTNADQEWAVLEEVIAQIDSRPVKIAKQGRPKAAAPKGWLGNDTVRLATGVILRKTVTPDGYAIEFSGRAIRADMIDIAMERLQYYFDQVD